MPVVLSLAAQSAFTGRASVDLFIRRNTLAGLAPDTRREPDGLAGRPTGGWVDPTRERDPMLTRTSVFTLAAVAAFAAAALAPTGASAKPVMGLIIKPTPVMGVVLPPHPVMGVVIHPPHPILGVVIPPHPHPIMGVIVHPPGGGVVDVDPPHIWWHRHHAPWIEEGYTTPVSTPVTTVPSGPCNCLTKTYLQDGSVLFKDVCTKEAAMATPEELRAQMQGAGPQAH
jgi:hypothetical protein